MSGVRSIPKMLRLNDDKEVLRLLCRNALKTTDPIKSIETALKAAGIGSRRCVHFCRGYIDAAANQ